MKKHSALFFAGALVLTLAIVTGCKKEGEPGPAGSNGKNGSALPYKQEGTELSLSGNYYADGVSFDNTLQLSYFMTLDENNVTVEDNGPILVRNSVAAGSDYYFHIVRRDSLNNSMISFDIAFYDGDEEPTIENLNIDVITDITGTSYKRISTGHVSSPARTSSTSDYFYRSSLDGYDIYDESNNLSISNWNYDEENQTLSFDFGGTLSQYFNSTQSDLTINCTVVADLKQESYRKGNE